jgi:hypothetical protein
MSAKASVAKLEREITALKTKMAAFFACDGEKRVFRQRGRAHK